MQNVAQAWLMYRLTESSLMLGLAAFFALFPVLILGLWSGVIADHTNRHKLLIAAHTAGMLQASFLAWLTLTGRIEPWHILILSAILGVIHALEMPARHSFLTDMVDRQDFANAIALNSSAFNLARFLGPAIAGMLIAKVGEGPIFLLNAISFLAVIFCLILMRLVPSKPIKSNATLITKIKEGLSFAWATLSIRHSLMLLSVFSIVGTSLTVLMPVFTKEVFLSGSSTLGLLLGSMGGGAIIAAFLMAYRSQSRDLGRRIGIAAFISGLCLIVFTLTKSLWIAVPILILAGFCQTLLAASTNTLIQLLVPDNMRGRVMSVFSTIFIGFMPIGSLSSGYIAEYLGASLSVLLYGVCSVVAAIIYLVKKQQWQNQMAL